MPSYSRKVTIPGRTAEELFDKVSREIEGFLSKASLGRYEIDRNAGSKQVKVKSTLFSATLVCTESCIEIDASLSLMAAPFRGKLDEGINKWLSKSFNLKV